MALIFSCEHCSAVFVGGRKASPKAPGYECICAAAYRAASDETRHDIAWWLRSQGVAESIVSGVERNLWQQRKSEP